MSPVHLSHEHMFTPICSFTELPCDAHDSKYLLWSDLVASHKLFQDTAQAGCVYGEQELISDERTVSFYKTAE